MTYDSMNQGIKGIGASGTESELHLQRLAWAVPGAVYSVLVLDIASHNTEYGAVYRQVRSQPRQRVSIQIQILFYRSLWRERERCEILSKETRPG